MYAIGGFIMFAGFICFFLGLIKPSIFNKKNPNRTKVLLRSLFGMIGGMILVINFQPDDSTFNMAQEYVEKEEYHKAFSKLIDIDKDSEFYDSAQVLKAEIGPKAAKSLFEEENYDDVIEVLSEIPQTEETVKMVYEAVGKEYKERYFTSNELLGKFSKNGVKAQEELKYSTVAVVGRIDDISKNIYGEPYATFKSKGMNSVQCFFATSYGVSDISSGQRAIITGTINDDALFAGNVLIQNCEVIFIKE